MSFNKHKYMLDMSVPVMKLLRDLAKEGIYSNFPDGEFVNITFAQAGKSIQISQHSFYGFSRMSQMSEVDEKSQYIKITPYSDEMWLQRKIKPIIIALLKAQR